MLELYEILPHLNPPCRAWKSAVGTLPARHHQCEPVRVASALGYYVFLPMTVHLLYDGGSVQWSPDLNDWHLLDSIMYPDCDKALPPFLTITEDHGIVQIWTGYVARTAPDYSLLVRGVPNYLPESGYQMLEGVIETDAWVGPLFTNIRLLHTHVPITLFAHRPFVQVVPLPREITTDAFLNRAMLMRPSAELDWPAFNRTLENRSEYIKKARRRQRHDH